MTVPKLDNLPAEKQRDSGWVAWTRYTKGQWTAFHPVGQRWQPAKARGFATIVWRMGEVKIGQRSELDLYDTFP